MNKEHLYATHLEWTGNLGEGTQNYRAYERNYEIKIGEGVPPILGSSDPAFLGDPTRYNPEQLLLASLSSCHLLWYLHLCSVEGISVISYEDHASGIMIEKKNGSGCFQSVTLAPRVTVGEPLNGAKKERVLFLHQLAGEKCFIANSVNFSLTYLPTLLIAS